MDRPQSVMFWRNGQWHVGWVQQVREDGGFQVAWIQGPCVNCKVVDSVIPLAVPYDVASNPPTK